MKKILTLLVIITTLLFNISNVYALDINIKEVTVYDKNDTITVSNISNDGLTISPKITFNNVNDYVTLKVTFKGKDISKYKINNIKDNNKSEYIKTSYSSKEDLTGPVFITLEYYKLASSNISLNDINITLDLENENGEEITINYNDNSNQDVSSSAQTGTLSYILTPLILITISLFLIKYYSKNNNISTMIILLLLIIPITVLASEKIALVLSTSNIQIKVKETSEPVPEPVTEPEVTTPKTYVVYLYPNEGTGITEGQKFEYTKTTPFSEFPKVTKTGCTLDGWNVGSVDGTKYYQNIDASDDGKKLYARWNCNTESSATGTQGTYYAPIQSTTNYSFGSRSSTAGCTNGNVYHDIAIGSGIPIYAGISGKAEFIQITGLISGERMLVSYGNEIKITSSDGNTVILYAHLNGFVSGISTPVTKTCPKGGSAPCPASSYTSSLNKTVVGVKTVKKGDLIGYTGDTGNSTGPHLHVEIKVNNSCVCDPFGAFGMRSKQC